MLSKDQIRETLSTIAANNNLYGEVANLLVQELTYILFHNQVEVLNAIQESNLSTAKLVNSKIRNCMSVMYPVYRGKSARVYLSFTPDLPVSAKKFDVIYSSNNFKIYAAESYSFTPTINTPIFRNVVGIISTEDLFESEVEITENNKYYIDFKINRQFVSNVSEDVQVFIDNVEYPVTRDFHSHVNQTLVEVDPLSPITSELDSLFILTIPDYGIRVFKKGYFKPSSIVKVRALKYTTLDEINRSEFNKIKLPNTTPAGTKIDYDNIIDLSNPSIDLSITPINTAIMEIARDNEKSLLYAANHYARVQGRMTTKADVDVLFQEYFIDQVRESISWSQNGTVYIFYIRKAGYPITESGFAEFKDKYKSYFINDNLVLVEAVNNNLNIDMTLYLKSSNELSTDVELIYNKYAYKLSDPAKFDEIGVELFNKKLVEAEIAKLPDVEFIDHISYQGSDIKAYELKDINGTSVKVPVYLTFNINIEYKSTYENIS